MSHTLSLIKNLHWIVVDEMYPSRIVKDILNRSALPHTYLGIHGKKYGSNAGRNTALRYIRTKMTRIEDAVVYFADDDNVYDIRLFDSYIRKVKTIGIWAVGTVGNVQVEYPKVENGVIIGYETGFWPNREFAVDMAGFAVNIQLLRETPSAQFPSNCCHYESENIFLQSFGRLKEEVHPFGYDDHPREVLVWHTQTHVGRDTLSTYSYGYRTEY
ncbi:hypothetical protein AB6A40_005724 [Gnathostoma spinigerum]|uniref:Galactosylgalactosylxylosylprotein 3-beta-glucuronosyltransferase n=1 Tax=Gnathostoma spinigerum TaxID=75299 RepID=A0ABD6EHF7_9BILA